MTDWSASLPGLWARCWAVLARGADDADAAARRVALATVAADGAPCLRTMALRRADAAAAAVDLHTDIASAKVGDLRCDPRAGLLVWDPAQDFQIRLALRVVVLSGPDVEPLWQAVPAAGRLNYGGTPHPGQTIDAPQEYAKLATRDRFAVLRGRVEAADLLHLGADMHRRAAFARDDGFAGRWIAP